MNYIGSKHSLLQFLTDTISEITDYKSGEGRTFADLFAGTGAVGAAYKKSGYNVISNDIQYYSYVLNKHLIENVPCQDSSPLDELNSLNGIEGFVYQNYCAGSGSGRNYFTDDNGKKCDAIRTKLEKMRADGEIDGSEYFYFLASLINSVDKYANTASVYGAFLKHIKSSAKKDMRLELLPVIPGIAGKVYNNDVNALIRRIRGDILYLDPPYNARQYCANYHVLETIARYDNPVLKGKTGLRENSAQKSLYCSKKTVDQALNDLIANADFKYIFLSYNNEGLMNFNTIKNIMSKYGKYTCRARSYHRYKADKDDNRQIAADSTTEYIHCLIKE